MDKQMVDLFLVMKQKYFAAEHLPYIRERLMQLTDEQFHTINGVELMDPTSASIASCWGISRWVRSSSSPLVAAGSGPL